MPGGIAAACGLVAGDVLLSINGEPVRDQIDYQFLSAQERLVIEVQTKDGISEVHLEKDGDEPLGIQFEQSLMSRPRTCANRCIFCFIDQMPPGMRPTLYVKDDDWRLSLMMGNYITLTNLSDREFQRIIDRRASPLYISVHATDGAIRARMMGSPRAALLMEQIARLKAAGIQFHCQVVCCPGVNDGPVLDDTLQTLSSLYPTALSVALVPVGLTRHREGLTALTPYTAKTAQALIEQAARWQASLLAALGTRFVFPSDEFYCLSGVALPPDEAYEGYPQLENGVGMLRSFEKEFDSAYRHADRSEAALRRVVIATGTSAAPFLRALIASHPLDVDVTVLAVPNRFFGESVTVAGLLTGQDLRPALAGIPADEILIASAMLRHEGDLFLDGDSIHALSQALRVPVHAVGLDGADFFYALMGELYQAED